MTGVQTCALPISIDTMDETMQVKIEKQFPVRFDVDEKTINSEIQIKQLNHQSLEILTLVLSYDFFYFNPRKTLLVHNLCVICQ